MNRINELQQAQTFEGVFRITSVRTLYTKTGKQYMRMQIDDATGHIITYAWQDQYEGPWEFDHLATIHVTGKTRSFNGQWVADICSSHVIEELDYATPLLPATLCKQPDLLIRFERIEKSINHPVLRYHFGEIFSDMQIAIPFMQVPASLKHHHNEAGGLMRHSIECAEIAASIPMLDGLHRELAIIGSLLHDAGKIRTFNKMKRTNSGYLIDHQALTLEVIARQLSSLEMKWPDAALALRHVLTCRSIKRWGYEPRMAIAHVVQLADKLSVEMDMENRSFNGINESRSTSARNTPEHQTYWRPRFSNI